MLEGYFWRDKSQRVYRCLRLRRTRRDRFTAMEHANIARVLERMGDHATRPQV